MIQAEWSFHPLADIFPLLEGKDFDVLCHDIQQNGLIEPIWTYQDSILDGRNRYRACLAVDVDPIFREYLGDDPVAFVISLNLHRRHLDEAQRAMVASKLATMRQGERTDLSPIGERSVSQAEAAELLSVSKKSVERGVKIRKEGDETVVGAVEGGQLSLHAAQPLLELPKEEQKAVLTQLIQDWAGDGKLTASKVEKAVKSLFDDSSPHVTHNSGENEWYTPKKYIDLAVSVMGGIDLDPASSSVANGVVGAKQYFTMKENGLQQKWFGRVWMNPPYEKGLIDQFIEVAASKFDAGEYDQAIILVNNATETKWFQRLGRFATAICFPAQRIKFLAADGETKHSPLQGQAFVYLGSRVEAFQKYFSREGLVLIRE